MRIEGFTEVPLVPLGETREDWVQFLWNGQTWEIRVLSLSLEEAIRIGHSLTALPREELRKLLKTK